MLAAGCVQGAEPLRGAGATFPYPLYQKWFAAFEKKFPEVSIEYQPLGSGSGIEELFKDEIDFAGSDIPVSDEELGKLPRKIKLIPTAVGGVVPIYHLDGILEDIRFTPEVLASIYLGKIDRWNDPAIRAVNHGISLPARKIAVVHRSDRSGTTFIWTDYLSKVSNEWKTTAGFGDKVRWPVGISADGNEGVTELVRRTPDSIGYVEFIYALQHRLSYGWVRNSAARFVQADLTTVPAAAADFASSIHDDFRISITNAPGPDSYPIAAFTYLLVPDEFRDPAKRKAMTDFLVWMLNSGQKQCAALGYAALPPQISERAQRMVEGR